MMEEKEVLVKVEGVSKKFCKDLKRSLWYGLKDLIPLSKSESNELRKDEFWAVKDVSFELRRGECLGLIGHNGAGKSTLLKMLNGLINPDQGKITMHGKVGALIELGAGFNPILTGRENIYNNGAVLGFSKEEINDKVDAIIDFAEIREFIDMPVKNYSSGMQVRLGFAVASQMEPDVLIIDEVLAVGDLGFVLKCFKIIDTILPKTALIFVSHNMPLVSRICNYGILLEKGIIKTFNNNLSNVIDEYYSKFVNNDSSIVFNDKSFFLKEFLLVDENNKSIEKIEWGDALCLKIRFNIKNDKIKPFFNILILDKEQRPVALVENNLSHNSTIKFSEENTIYVKHDNLQLSKGIYTINLEVLNSVTKGPLFRINNVISFQVKHYHDNWQPFLLKSTYKTSNER